MQVCRGGDEISFTNMGLVAEMVLAQVCVHLVSSFVGRLAAKPSAHLIPQQGSRLSTAAHVQWPSQNYYFRHRATMPQEPTPQANRPTNELTKRTHTCANTISATNPIFVNEISSPPLHTCV